MFGILLGYFSKFLVNYQTWEESWEPIDFQPAAEIKVALEAPKLTDSIWSEKFCEILYP